MITRIRVVSVGRAPLFHPVSWMEAWAIPGVFRSSDEAAFEDLPASSSGSLWSVV